MHHIYRVICGHNTLSDEQCELRIIHIVNYLFLRANKNVSSEQQESVTDSDQVQVENNDIELLPAVEHHLRSHDATVGDSMRSHDVTVPGNSDISISGLSYRQLLQQDNIEYDRILNNESSDCESGVLERETENEFSRMLDAKQGMIERTRKAFTSTFTVTLLILRYPHTYVQIHTHIHTCTYTHTHMHTHIQTHVHTHTHTDTRIHTHTRIHTCIHTYTHAYTHTYTHTHTLIRTCIHTHTHMHTQTYTHTHMHTHIHVCIL